MVSKKKLKKSAYISTHINSIECISSSNTKIKASRLRACKAYSNVHHVHQHTSISHFYSFWRELGRVKNCIRFLRIACWVMRGGKKCKNGEKQQAREDFKGMRNRLKCTFWNITGRWLTPCTTKQKRGKKTIPHVCYMHM